MATIELDGATIHYLTEGSGPPIILLHSLGGCAEMWRRTINDLSASFTIIAPDARGHGSSPAAGPISVERFAQDALAIADTLQLSQFGLLGLSMGGQAAMHVAISAPERVRFLIAADTSLGAASKNPDRLESVRRRIDEIGAEAFAYEYTRSRLQPNVPEDEVRAFAEMVMRTLPETYVTQLGSILAQDLRSSVAAIRCPTLILVGAQDVSTPPSTGEQLAKAITGAKFQIIDDANHLSNIDQPEAFNAAVRAFAAEVPSPSGP